MITCRECPRCKDAYPGKVDMYGNHFCICGMSGNMVYPMPRKKPRHNGRGYIHFGPSSCGIYDTVEDALKKMTESEIRRWKERTDDRNIAVLPVP